MFQLMHDVVIGLAAVAGAVAGIGAVVLTLAALVFLLDVILATFRGS